MKDSMIESTENQWLERGKANQCPWKDRALISPSPSQVQQQSCNTHIALNPRKHRISLELLCDFVLPFFSLLVYL